MTTLPPFDGGRFDLWKVKFETFIKDNDFEIWDILNNNMFITTLSINYEVINKPEFDWTEEDLKKVKLGLKVKHLLINALSSKLFYNVFTNYYKKKILTWLGERFYHECWPVVKKGAVVWALFTTTDY